MVAPWKAVIMTTLTMTDGWSGVKTHHATLEDDEVKCESLLRTWERLTNWMSRFQVAWVTSAQGPHQQATTVAFDWTDVGYTTVQRAWTLADSNLY